MKSGRSKLMVELVGDQSKSNLVARTTVSNENIDYYSNDSIAGTPDCSSPLPPGASEIVKEMNDIFNEAISDGFQEIKCEGEENMYPCILPVSSPACVLREDHFMSIEQTVSLCLSAPGNQLSPQSLLNISSVPTPALISNLSSFPPPILPDNDYNAPTPVPSPISNHSEICNNAFCPIHDDDIYRKVPSINTNVASCKSSPAPVVNRRGKKRLRNYDNWAEVRRKRLKNEGKSYSTKRGNIVPAKSIGKSCACRYKCENKFSLEERKDAFEKFWKLGNREKQWLHVVNYTTKEKKKRGLQRDLKHNRQFTYKYFLPQNLSKTEVCKTMFLSTYSISERVVRTAWDKYDGSTSVENDMRGKHKNHSKIVNDEMIMSVCAHVNSFAPVESHYSKASSKKLYLDSSLSIAKMFDLYKDWPKLNNYSTKAFSLRQYRDIVNTHFNLGFYVPKKDQCDQCHSFKHIENPSDELKEAYSKHQNSKTFSRTMKSNDKKDALNSNGRIVCASFDFQKVLTCPHGQMGVLYYKRKLSCYNFTIYNMANKQGFCYMWDESVAKRGANEVASCVYDFVKKFALNGAKEFRFWSDNNCAGQNRNRIVFYMYAHVAKEFDVTIVHRFLEKGHAQSEGDSVHSVIERAAERKIIYSPEEWKIFVKWARVTGESYEVIDVNQTLVFDFKDQLKNKNWVKNTDNNKVIWTNVKEVCVEATQTNKIRYKYALSDDYMTLVLRKETRSYNIPTLCKAYTDSIPITNAKYKDLISLCDSGIIPLKYHDFFKGLTHGRNVPNDDDDSD